MGRWMDTETELMLDTTPTVYVRTIDATEIMEQAANAGVKLDSDATLYAIHDENGQRMAVFSDREAAFAAARDLGAEPVSVH